MQLPLCTPRVSLVLIALCVVGCAGDRQDVSDADNTESALLPAYGRLLPISSVDGLAAIAQAAAYLDLPAAIIRQLQTREAADEMLAAARLGKVIDLPGYHEASNHEARMVLTLRLSRAATQLPQNATVTAIRVWFEASMRTSILFAPGYEVSPKEYEQHLASAAETREQIAAALPAMHQLVASGRPHLAAALQADLERQDQHVATFVDELAVALGRYQQRHAPRAE